jgi:hypothetical protein
MLILLLYKLTFFLAVKVECEQLHGSLDAAEKVAAQLRWRHQKQMRVIEVERDQISVREQSCLHVDKRQSRHGNRLQMKETNLQKEKRSTVDLRQRNVAELKHAREAQNLIAETIIFTRPSFSNSRSLFACFFCSIDLFFCVYIVETSWTYG